MDPLEHMLAVSPGKTKIMVHLRVFFHRKYGEGLTFPEQSLSSESCSDSCHPQPSKAAVTQSSTETHGPWTMNSKAS